MTETIAFRGYENTVALLGAYYLSLKDQIQDVCKTPLINRYRV